MKPVYVVGTCDTKEAELRYAADHAAAAGAPVVLVDISTTPSMAGADVTPEMVARHHPLGASAVLGHADRGRAVAAMAQALALQPALLLLDEPTASLDPHAKREVEALMEEFARSHPQAAMVFASHNLGQVKRLAQRVIYLEGGRVLADLPVADFFDPAVLQSRSPSAHLFTQGELA